MKVSQGIYEHYKSTPDDPKYYQVLFLSHFEETHEVMVHYVPMYWSNENSVYDDGVSAWTRTLKNFCEEVEWNGKMIARFKRISE